VKILVTGAAGRVGSTVARGLAPRHEVRGHDRVPMPFLTDTVVSDLTDFDAVLRATEGMDAVAHIGGLPGGIPAGMPLYAVFGAQWGSIATLSREGHRTAAGDEQGLSGAVAFARVQSTGREGCDEKGKTDRAGLAVSVPVSRGAGYGLCSPGACARTT